MPPRAGSNARRLGEREDDIKVERLDGRNLLVEFVNKGKRSEGEQAMSLGSVEVAHKYQVNRMSR